LSKKIKIADLISYLWYEIGYRYETIWNRSVEMYNYMYDMLFELARKADVDSIGLAEFVDNVDSYQDESEKLDGMEIPLESSEGVHILSIFKSKGLEYPVVFLCSIGKDSKADVNDKTKLELIKDFDYVLSLQLLENGKALAETVENTGVDAELESFILAKIEERAAAKKAKDFATADAIRDELLSKGVAIKDTREGVKWELI
jgi:ATP-dependent exoDNAse (exonuclease V) beta subunit